MRSLSKNWAYHQEMKLEVEILKREQEKKVRQTNPRCSGIEDQISIQSLVSPQCLNLSPTIQSLCEKREDIHGIHRVILGEESSNFFSFKFMRIILREMRNLYFGKKEFHD